MKVTSALAILAASLAAAQAQEPAPAPADQLYIALFQIKDVTKFAQNLVDMFVTDSETGTTIDPVVPESIVTWEQNCIKGQIAITQPDFEMDFSDISSLGLSSEDIAKLVEEMMNPDGLSQSGIDMLKKAYAKILSKLKFEAKIYFVSNAELMAKPECAQNAIAQYFDSLEAFGTGVFETTMYKAIPDADFAVCVKTDAEGTQQPVCGNYVEATNPEEYKAQQACVACSITSNSIIASTVAAAAMVAAALFF